jgi:hypothetical protein
MHSDPNGPQLELAGAPLSLAGYQFNYFVGGNSKPLIKTRILIAPLQKPELSKSENEPTGKDKP